MQRRRPSPTHSRPSGVPALLQRWLAERQILSVLVEGGPALQEACAAEGLIDRVQVAVSPRTLGESGAVPAAAFIRRALVDPGSARRRTLGDDRLIEWDVHRADRSNRAS